MVFATSVSVSLLTRQDRALLRKPSSRVFIFFIEENADDAVEDCITKVLKLFVVRLPYCFFFIKAGAVGDGLIQEFSVFKCVLDGFF